MKEPMERSVRTLLSLVLLGIVACGPTSDGDGSRMPSEQELEGARFQGQRVAEIAAKLAG